MDAIDLRIEHGQLVCLLGPSGCGKTTTLRLLAGFLTPDGGEIRVGDRVVSAPGNTLPPERRNMSMIFQSYAVWPHMTVAENVAYGLKLRKMSKDEIKQRVGQILDVTHLDRLAERFPSELSGGQQQRVALARALVVEPEFVARFIGGTNILKGQHLGDNVVECKGIRVACGQGQSASGGETAISIRLHEINLLTEPPATNGLNVGEGRVLRQVYLGSTRDYMVELSNGIVDVINSSDASHFVVWKRDGWLAQHVPPDVKQHYAPEHQDKEGFYATWRSSLSVMGYNTKLVTKEEAPKSFADLLDPKWKGKIVKAHPGYSGTIVTATFAIARDIGWDYIEKLAQQSVMRSSPRPPHPRSWRQASGP